MNYVRNDPVNLVDPDGNAWNCGPVDPREPGGRETCAYMLDPPGPNIWQRIIREPKSNWPECNSSDNPTTEMKLNWIMKNWDYALGEANKIKADLNGVSIDTSALATMFLQWSANESSYGRDPANIAENNYFGIQNASILPDCMAVQPLRALGEDPAIPFCRTRQMRVSGRI
jgi:hypothetical protein